MGKARFPSGVALLLVFFGCSTPPARDASTQPLPAALDSLGLKSELAQTYTVSDLSDATSDNIRVRNLTARASDGRVLRVEKLDGAKPSQYDDFVTDKVEQLNSLYHPVRDPYFSVLTKQTLCPDRFKPQISGNEKDGVRVIQLFANDRLTYGACTDDEVAFRAIVAIGRCPGDKSLFLLESFVPVKLMSDADLSAARSMSCKP